MDTIKKLPPKEHQAFFKELGQIFKKHPGMNNLYAIKVEKKNADGCCKYCVDDEGNTFCCESGPDCHG